MYKLLTLFIYLHNDNMAHFAIWYTVIWIDIFMIDKEKIAKLEKKLEQRKLTIY